MRKLFLGLMFFAVMGFVGLSVYNQNDDKPAQVRKLIQSVVKIKVGAVVEDPETGASIIANMSATGFSSATNGKDVSFIMTNKHVCVMGNNAEYTLSLSDGSSAKARFLIMDTFADLCVLTTKKYIPSLKFAIKNADQGDKVMTIGAPDGVFPVVLDGNICGYAETNMKNNKDEPDFEIHFRTQVVSVPVYPGSSGSPVLDNNNRVVGVVFAVRGEKEHIAFIVPVSEVWRFINRTEYVRG